MSAPRAIEADAVLVAAGSEAAEARSADESRAVLEQAYTRHGSKIARRLLALTGEPAVVDDLVNETFVRAWQLFDRFEGRSELSTWLHGIAVNVARGYLAKQRRRRRLDERGLAPSPASSSAEQSLQQGRAAQRLYAVLVELPDALREAFVMCVLEQRPLKEVAAELGVPVSTLHARRQRAEARVRASLEEGEA